MARLPAQRRNSANGGGSLGLRMETLRQALLVTVSGYSPSIVELFTDDVVGASPLMSVRNRNELASVLRGRDQLLTEIELQLEATDMVDGRLLGEWVVSARPADRPDRTDAETPENAGRLTLRGVTMARFLGSQIQQFRHYWDELVLIESLGLESANDLRMAFRRAGLR